MPTIEVLKERMKETIENLVKVLNNPNSTEEEIKAADKKFAEAYRDVWDYNAIRIQ